MREFRIKPKLGRLVGHDPGSWQSKQYPINWRIVAAWASLAITGALFWYIVLAML